MTTTQFEALLKDVYGTSIKYLQSEGAMFTVDYPFSKTKGGSVGNEYVVAVVATDEQGVTYGIASDGAFALNSAVSMSTLQARITSTQVITSFSMDLDTISRAMEGGKEAFASATRLQFGNAKRTMTRRQELTDLYGGTHAYSGIGNVSASSGLTPTTATVTISLPTWAAGLWSGLKNVPIDFYTSVAGLPTTLLNATGAVSVTQIDVSTRTLTISAAAADITAITGAGAGPFIFFRGAYGKEYTGLTGVVPIQSGTVYGINVTQNELFQGNVFDCANSALTMNKILGGLDLPAARGLDQDQAVTLYCNPKAIRGLVGNEAALRMYDSSYEKTAENGFDKLRFFSPNSGPVTIKPCRWIKEGLALAIAEGTVTRGGACDITMDPSEMGIRVPGFQLVWNLPSNAGIGARMYSNQYIFMPEGPSKCVMFTNIVNPT